jgi:hypothetical protein
MAARHRLTVEEKIRGLRSALASPRTPRHLRPALEKHMAELRRRLEHKRKTEEGAKRNHRSRKPAHLGLLDWLGL